VVGGASEAGSGAGDEKRDRLARACLRGCPPRRLGRGIRAVACGIKKGCIGADLARADAIEDVGGVGGDREVALIELTRVRAPVRRAWLLPLTIALASLAVVDWSFTLRGPENVALFLLMFIGGMSCAAIAAFVAPRWATRPPRMRRRVALDRHEIVGVEVVSTRPFQVLLYDRRLDAYEWQPNESAEEALARIGLTARTGIARFYAQPLASVYEAFAALATILLTFFIVSYLHGPVIVVLIPLLAFIALCATPSEVLVGADGVHIRWLTRRGFARITSVERAELRTLGVVLRLAGGRSFHHAMPHEHALRFVERVGAMRAAVEASVRSDLEPRLARRDRSLKEWLGDLRALVREPMYRDAPVLPLVLWRIVDDPSRSDADRAAAAIALASTDPAARARIADVACATAQPELRAVLDAIADDDAIETPLARLAQ
jgi:hypothetical protein